LRAVIIVPVKELIFQVKKLFNDLTKNTNLKVIALSTGISLTVERNLLTQKDYDLYVNIYSITRLWFVC
jgi:superfamily II DNA/RNA helicase